MSERCWIYMPVETDSEGGMLGFACLADRSIAVLDRGEGPTPWLAVLDGVSGPLGKADVELVVALARTIDPRCPPADLWELDPHEPTRRVGGFKRELFRNYWRSKVPA